MSLRRTALKRKTQLRRGGELRRTPLLRKKPLQVRKVAAAKRPRDTGPTSRIRGIVVGRSGGVCEVCGRLLHDGRGWIVDAHNFHHRQPRGMGGTSRVDANSPANLLLVCGSGNSSGCHGMIESNRRQAYAEGWLVAHGDDPADTPCTIAAGTPDFSWSRVVILTPDGDYEELAA